MSKYIFNGVSSLENLARIKIAFQLWIQPSIKRVMCEKFMGFSEFADLVCIVEKKADKLRLPECQKQKLKQIIEPIGKEILRWLKYHITYFPSIKTSDADHFHYFCWKPLGILDKKRTAELLIKSKIFTVKENYELACIYCVDTIQHEDADRKGPKVVHNYISALWSLIDEKDKFYERHEHPLVVLWTYSINGKLNELVKYTSSPNEYGFREAIHSGNEVATEYFWYKLQAELSPIEREKTLMSSALLAIRYWPSPSLCSTWGDTPGFSKECYINILCFFLSHMAERQQEEVFRSYIFTTRYFVFHLLDWPYREFFSDLAKCLWPFIHGDMRFNTIYIIAERMFKERSDYYYELLTYYWNRSCDSLKLAFLESEEFGGLLLKLAKLDDFGQRDKELIEMLMQDVSLEEKETLMFSDCGKLICTSLIEKDRLELFHLFIRLCLSPLEDTDKVIQFKRSLTNELVLAGFISKKKWTQADYLLDWCFGGDESAVSRFKKRSFYVIGEAVLTTYLRGCQQLAVTPDTFFEWCQVTDAVDIAVFKKRLVSSNRVLCSCLDFFGYFSSGDDPRDMEVLLEWFLPATCKNDTPKFGRELQKLVMKTKNKWQKDSAAFKKEFAQILANIEKKTADGDERATKWKDSASKSCFSVGAVFNKLQP